MRLRLIRFSNELRESYWFIPTLMAIAQQLDAYWQDHGLAPSRGYEQRLARCRVRKPHLPANADGEFTNSELQRHEPDADALLANPNVRRFVDRVAKEIRGRIAFWKGVTVG